MGHITTEDIQMYNYVVQKAKLNGIEVIIKGNSFHMKQYDKTAYFGKFNTVEEMHTYMCGYETGLDRGLIDSIN